MPFNGLTPAESERLALLAEEAGELVQIIGKVLRHGFESHHPSGGPTNRELLEAELGDVLAASHLMAVATDVSRDTIDDLAESKLERVGHYLHHQPERLLSAVLLKHGEALDAKATHD